MRRWDELKLFFCVYDPCKYPKYDTAKHSLFKLHRMLQHLQINFELYWDSERYLSIDKQTIGFHGRYNDKLRITFKDAGDGFQYDAFVIVATRIDGNYRVITLFFQKI